MRIFYHRTFFLPQRVHLKQGFGALYDVHAFLLQLIQVVFETQLQILNDVGEMKRFDQTITAPLEKVAL